MSGLANTDVAMFYFSGHGIQIKDENYLVATDAGIKDLKHGFVPVQPIVDALQKQSRATLVLLDACRNNPLAEGGQPGLSVSTGRGLGRIKDATLANATAAIQARGLLVAYSTSPNSVALDGAGNAKPRHHPAAACRPQPGRGVDDGSCRCLQPDRQDRERVRALVDA